MIVVTATRSPRELREVAASVSVVTREVLDRDFVLEPRDLARAVPALQVESGGTRFGTSGFRIRGIGGNRVTTLIDGVPLAERFAIRAYSDSGRDLLSLGMVSSMEVLRGPASTLYGSKAIGGVVAIRTLEPEDLLQPGRPWAADAGLIHSGHRDQQVATASLAFGNSARGLLLSGGALRANEVRAAADGPRDPQDDRRESVMMRYVHVTEGGQRIRATAQGWQSRRATDNRSLLGTGSFVATTSLLGEDTQRHWRLLVDGELALGGGAVEASWRSFATDSDVNQLSRERRSLPAGDLAQQRRFEYRQRFQGLAADVRHAPAALGGFEHRFAWGLELTRGEVEELRDGLQTNLATGVSTNILLGERFPLRDFPVSRTLEAGAYLQSELRLPERPLTLLAGLRVEHYRLSPSDDETFRSGAPTVDIVAIDDWTLTPKLAAIWQFDRGISGFVQYVRGYRSPPFSDVNIGFEVPAFNTRALPNPDLRPETSHALEAGLRGGLQAIRWEAAVFQTWYRDFIVSRAPLGPDPATGVLLFQSINLTRSRIHGLEFSWRYQPSGLDSRFSLELAGLWLRERSEDPARPVSNVDPAQLSGAVGLRATPTLGLRLAGTAVRGRSQEGTVANAFRPGGHLLLDTTADWDIRDSTRLRVGVFNITDRTAWRWSEVVGRPSSDPMLPQLSQPDRYVAVSLHQHW